MHFQTYALMTTLRSGLRSTHPAGGRGAAEDVGDAGPVGDEEDPAVGRLFVDWEGENGGEKCSGRQ